MWGHTYKLIWVKVKGRSQESPTLPTAGKQSKFVHIAKTWTANIHSHCISILLCIWEMNLILRGSLSDFIFPFLQLERPIQFYQTTLLSQELFGSLRFITKHWVLKSQKSETHLSPTRQKQTMSRKWANPGMAVEEHDMRHLNCSSASEPELEEPSRGTESGICGPEDITSTKQCTAGTNHHIASVWITKKRDNVSSNPQQTLYIWLLAPINVIGWVKNKQTNKQKAQQGAAEKPHCARQEEQE